MNNEVREVESLEGITALEFDGSARELLLKYEQARAKGLHGAEAEAFFKEVIGPYMASIGLELGEDSLHVNGVTEARLKPVKVAGGEYSTEVHFMHMGETLCAFATLVPKGGNSMYCLNDALVHAYRGSNNPFVKYVRGGLAVAPLSGMISVHTSALVLSELLAPHMPELVALHDLASVSKGKEDSSAMGNYIAKLEEALGAKTA